MRLFREICVEHDLIANLGGSLGWKGKGALLPEFEKVAFELEVSSISSPKWAEYVSV